MSKIYVSTYQKYTTGTMKGEWLDLSHYASRDDFLAACAELHSDESDPELMFQDWEEMPAQFVRESFIDEQVWAWLELSDEERETVAIYLSDVNQDATIETALGEYDGEHESEQDWARDFWTILACSDRFRSLHRTILIMSSLHVTANWAVKSCL